MCNFFGLLDAGCLAGELLFDAIQICFDHFGAKITNRGLRCPAQRFLGLCVIALEYVNLGWPEISRVDLNDGRRIRIAHDYTRAVGELPEVEFEEGASAGPMTRMRRIAKLVDERVARAQRAPP